MASEEEGEITPTKKPQGGQRGKPVARLALGRRRRKRQGMATQKHSSDGTEPERVSQLEPWHFGANLFEQQSQPLGLLERIGADPTEHYPADGSPESNSAKLLCRPRQMRETARIAQRGDRHHEHPESQSDEKQSRRGGRLGHQEEKPGNDKREQRQAALGGQPAIRHLTGQQGSKERAKRLCSTGDSNFQRREAELLEPQTEQRPERPH